MKQLLAAAAVVVVFLTSALAAELTGYISDDSCAIRGAKSATAAEWVDPDEFEACAKHCVKEGSIAVFVTEDNKILRLDARSNARALPLVGHRVRVTGRSQGGTLTINSIAAIAMKPTAASASDHHRSRP
jgi:hypothetical protein